MDTSHSAATDAVSEKTEVCFDLSNSLVDLRSMAAGTLTAMRVLSFIKQLYPDLKTHQQANLFLFYCLGLNLAVLGKRLFPDDIFWSSAGVVVSAVENKWVSTSMGYEILQRGDWDGLEARLIALAVEHVSKWAHRWGWATVQQEVSKYALCGESVGLLHPNSHSVERKFSRTRRC
jgi:hypothetical protein